MHWIGRGDDVRYLPLEDDRRARRDGEVVLERWPDGTPRTIGRVARGRRVGVWTRWFRDGRRAEEASYRDGRLHGPTTTWYPNGRVRAELSYQDDQLHGPFATWHANGHMAEDGEFLDGLPHRELARFWPNGRRRLVGQLDRGVPEGGWKVYSRDGVLMYAGGWDPDLLEWLTPWIRSAVEAVTTARPVLASVG